MEPLASKPFRQKDTMQTKRQTINSSPKRQRRKDERPGEILKAALELFLAHGYAATRLEDIATLACITKGSVYNYFPSKETLFIAVIENNTKCQVDSAVAIIKEHQGSMTSLIRILLTTWWDSVFSKTTGDLLKIIITESPNFPAIGRLYLDTVIEPLQAILIDVVRRGVASGEFRAIDADAVSRVPLGNLMMLALWRVSFAETSSTCDFAKDVSTTVDVYLHGLAPTAASGCTASPVDRSIRGHLLS